MFVEIIAHTVEDIKQINKTTADRIELCGVMEEDGLTPEIDLIKKVSKISEKPFRVMIRNHNRDFYYTETEIEKMIEQIEICNQIPNIDGYVIGALNKEQTELNIDQMKRLIKAAGGRNITFHKACERILNKESINQLIELKINTILTQGGLTPILENTEMLKELSQYNEQMQILLGGGVNLENIKILKKISPNVHLGSAVRLNKSYDQPIDPELVNKIKKI